MTDITEDAVWEALARALTGEYEILARLGIGSAGAPVYLARELVTDNLVALRLPPLVSGNEAQEYGLEIVRQLDASLPEIETRCSHCGATLRQWARFCTRCGRDISGFEPSVGGQSRDQLRALARETAAGKYEVLGEMTRAEGGGLVYFGRELATGQVVGLQLEPGPEATVLMTATQFAESDPSVEIAHARRASNEQLAKRVSVPRDRISGKFARSEKETRGAAGATPLAARKPSTRRGRQLAVIAVILLLIIVVTSTCPVL